jgi:hypothetical protein
MLVADARRQLDRAGSSSPDCSPDEAIEAVERHIRVKLKQVQRKAVEWSEKFDWSVVWVCGEHGPIGASIMLPLTECSYEELRAGKIEPTDLTADDLRIPSDQILVLTLGIRPLDMGGPRKNATLSLIGAMLQQWSLLANVRRFTDHAGGGRRLRSLAMASNSWARQVLRVQGYIPVGTTAKGTGDDWFERTVTAKRAGLEGLLLSAILHFGLIMRGAITRRWAK